MQKNTDFFQSYEAMEQEIEVLDREQTLRIEIDSGLETALRELEDLKSQMPKEKAQNLFELCETNVINTIKGQFDSIADKPQMKMPPDIVTPPLPNKKTDLKSAIKIVMEILVKKLFAEIRHIFKHFGDESFSEIFARLKERLSKVISEIKQDFKGIFEGSIEQSIGAFLSNIVLFVVNIVKGTFINLTKIIRAGLDSFKEAIKILANPPANMPKDEVAFEALKVFTAGIITAGSLFLEEGIDKFITTICPFLVPFSPFIATTLSALIGGVLSTIVLYYMDKAFNGAKKSRLQLQIMTKSGEVVSYKIAQSYFVLKDSYEYLADTAQRYEDKITGIRQFLADSGKEADSALDELAMTLKDLENKGV